MADFESAFNATMKHEGGYANNPHDHGGETYKGIARKCHSTWRGWKFLDIIKGQLTKSPPYGTKEYYNWARFLNSELDKSTAFQSMVLSFYKDNFWKRLGEIEDQSIASWVFDKDVNTGSMGSKWLQEAAGATVDGVVGSKTIAVVNQCNPTKLLEYCREKAKNFYLNLALKDPSQSRFLQGWLARV